MKNKLTIKSILGGKPAGKDHSNNALAKTIDFGKVEEVEVTNPITGKTSLVVINRGGTTDERVASIMLAKDATREQKDAIVGGWLFERGKENASFLAELFLSKGTHTKETQAFKRQVRFDFEAFANTTCLLFNDMARAIKKDIQTFKEGDKKESNYVLPMGGDNTVYGILVGLADRFESGAELITKEIAAITEARMREKGFGMYLDKSGKAYSVFDKEIEEVVKKDREDALKLKREQDNEK